MSTFAGLGKNMPATIIANEDYLAENEDIVVRYLAASLESLLWAASDEDSVYKEKADWYYEVMTEDLGISMEEQIATDICGLCDFKDLAFYESLCEKDADGKTGLQKNYEIFFDNHVMVGLATEEDKETVLAGCDASYLEKAIALYKETNGIA